MKTAEEFAQEACAMIGDIIKPKEERGMAELFQEAIDYGRTLPHKFVDGFIPDEDGYYGYERYKNKIKSLIWIGADNYGNLVAYEARTESFIGLVEYCKGKFTRRIRLEGE